MKNVIKAVKKLKLWAKKKRKKKKKTHEHEHEHEHPPPPPCHYCCSSTFQPSAPTLPSSSWLEAEPNYGTFLPPQSQEVVYPIQPQQQPQPQDIAVSSSSSSNSLYQQYMVSVSEPVYGIPLLPVTRERTAGHFGCVFSYGTNLFRCLCPCFHIRELV
ncbi:uncharacterized protein LOC133318041 [Gastrolobium bilobum]|uniref:uncharacterized protein LOC133318041 n=1 Tax=Gastrolobium bilobum TaxID=150636 RepID=UPI002AB09011|nr:uncharacterized protein LOC133318041 [Gastrolobium bilobum]